MRSNKAFTLVELMIVISIVGMLSTIAIPKFSDMVRKAEEAVTKNNLGILRSVTSIYYADHTGVWPYENTDLSADGSLDNTCSLLSVIDGGIAIAPKYVSEIPVVKTGIRDYAHEKDNAVTVAEDGGTYSYDDKTVLENDSAWVYYKDLGTWYVNCGEQDTKGDAIHSW